MMDSTTRLKALARLSESLTPAAAQALKEEFEDARAKLLKSSDYDVLEASLEVIATIGFRFSKAATEAIFTFIRSIESKDLRHPPAYDELGSQVHQHRNALTLMSSALDVLTGLRYLQTQDVTTAFLWASTYKEEAVRRSAFEGLQKVAKFNLRVFAGDDTQPGVGARPQLEVLTTLEAMSPPELVEHWAGVLGLFEGLLSSSMERAVWSSTGVTLQRGITPATVEVREVRAKSIALLRVLYNLASSTSERLHVLRLLNSAARVEGYSAPDEQYARMIEENACTVLSFFLEVVPSAALQIIQRIEHDSYWMYARTASPRVKEAALAVKSLIDTNGEYSIYKVLIGFEGVFGDWTAEDRKGHRELSAQAQREHLAVEYVQEISEANFEMWRARMVEFARTESNDLATFPVFYRFLEAFTKAHPSLAWRLLVEDVGPLAKFLIPVLRGIWDSPNWRKLKYLLVSWIEAAPGASPCSLSTVARLFLSAGRVDLEILQSVAIKAIEVQDVDALNQVVAVAVVRSADQPEIAKQLKSLFFTYLERLTEIGSANWISEVWFQDGTKAVFESLDTAECSSLLRNLWLLPRIDHQTEEILGPVAAAAPSAVLEFLCNRAMRDDDLYSGDRWDSGYEAIPFELDQLRLPLSKNPSETVGVVREYYRRDSTLFQFRGAKLLQAIFPTFSPELENELMRLVREGGVENIEFALSILHAYSGQTFLYPLCKEIVTQVSSGSPLREEVAAVLSSTGVIMGEFGMVNAYEEKRAQLQGWLVDPNEKVRSFAIWYTEMLDERIRAERQRAEESIALRKFQYGET